MNILYTEKLNSRNMKNLISFFVVLFAISSLVGQEDNRLTGIEEDLNEILEATLAPGFAVAVVEKDQVIYAKGFGYSDFENQVPADENTLYAIGSCTKAFTSGVLGQLRHEDKISFDESPRKYVPQLKFYNDEMDNNIIVKDLMAHRTGIPRHDWSWYLFPTLNKDSLIQRIQYQEPFTGVREQWYYNNFMFLAQGVIAEKITGKSWEENIRERFFEPLEMNRSNLSINELEDSSNAALGYELKKDSIISKMDYYHISGMGPAGSINSSVNEMSNWMIAWINGGKFKEKEIIPESYREEAMSSHMVINASLPDDEFPDMHLANYGYGWIISSYRGHYRVQHGGNIDGFSANAAFFPSDSIGIVVLTNQNGSAVPSLVRNTIADRMLNTEVTNWAKRFKDRQEEAAEEEAESNVESEPNNVKNTSPSHALTEYSGKYANPGYGEFEMTVEDDSLFAHFPLMKLYLKHIHYDVFEPYEVTDSGIDTSDNVGGGGARFNFETNDAGDISLVKINAEPAVDPIEFTHTPNTIDVDAETLEKYVGSFDLAGTTIKTYTKNEKTLYLFVTGQPEYELLATNKHKFSFKTLEGFKVEFVEGEDSSINEVIIYQPNGTFKATRNE